MPLAFLRNPLVLASGLIAAVLFVGWLYGRHQYRAGVTETTQQFIAADKEGAEDATQTAERVLRDLGGVDDPDGLLERTGGLRD